ncbi:MAG: T9SS C-terminal target domain-containing protein [Acidobacteria bacterium]|nr:MAG: T9SS C-terminal target domain-containing protein [Acidobacteriota bacterium]
MKMELGLGVMLLALVSLVSPTLAEECTCVGTWSDYFADGVLDSTWVVGGPACGSVSEAGGELLLSKSSCNGSLSFTMDPSKVTVCGDFDAQVDFRVTAFTANNYARYASFQVRDAVNGSNRAIIERYAENPPFCAPSTHLYKSWINVANNCDANVKWANTLDTSGRFRIQRVGDQISLYYWAGAWILLKSATWVTGAVAVGVYTGTVPLVGTASQAYFDNLTITSQECPTSVRAVPLAVAHLLQNYPNPFNPETNIAFVVPNAGARISIEILDVRGRRVRTLLRGWSDGGPHSVPWDGRDDTGREVGSGVYFCRLHSAAGADTKKTVLLR